MHSRSLEIPVKCKRCTKEKIPKYFIDTLTGECAAYITVHAECSLWVPKKEQERVQSEKRQKKLALLSAEAEVIHLCFKIAQAEEEEQAFAIHNTYMADVIESLKGETLKSRVANASFILPPFLPLTNLGWSQANSSFFNLSNFLSDFPLLGLNVYSSGGPGSSSVIPYSL